MVQNDHPHHAHLHTLTMQLKYIFIVTFLISESVVVHYSTGHSFTLVAHAYFYPWCISGVPAKSQHKRCIALSDFGLCNLCAG